MEVWIIINDEGVMSMPVGQKQCPGCKELIWATRKTCDCGHVFARKPKSLKKPIASLREIESDEPEFAAALAIDGRLMLVWPRQAESVTLSVDEAALVLRALLAPGKRVVSADAVTLVGTQC